MSCVENTPKVRFVSRTVTVRLISLVSMLAMRWKRPVTEVGEKRMLAFTAVYSVGLF